MSWAEVALACWLIACAYVPFVLWLTAEHSPEERAIARGLTHHDPLTWHLLSVAATRPRWQAVAQPAPEYAHAVEVPT